MTRLSLPSEIGSQESTRFLKALMLGPEGETNRKQFFAHFSALDLAADARHRTDAVTIPAWMLVALVDPKPGKNLAQRIKVAEKQGRAVGELLFLFYSLDRIASRTGADFQAEDSFSSLKKEVATHLGMSDAWLEKAWGNFKSVAHFWAAEHAESMLLPAGTNTFGPEYAGRFLATATVLERFAVTYKAASQHMPLIDPGRIVSVAGIVSEEEVDRVFPGLERLLHKYAVRQ